MLGSVEAGLKVIMRLEEGKNAEVDFARCSPQAAVVCLHNAPLLGPRGNRQGWETYWNHNIVPVAVSGKKGGVGAVCRFSQTDKGGSRGSTTKLHLLRDRKIS